MSYFSDFLLHEFLENCDLKIRILKSFFENTNLFENLTLVDFEEKLF